MEPVMTAIVSPGHETGVEDSIRQAIDIATLNSAAVEFKVEKVLVQVTPTSDPKLVYRELLFAMYNHRSAYVGPGLRAVISEKEMELYGLLKEDYESRLKRWEDAKSNLVDDIKIVDHAKWQFWTNYLNPDGIAFAIRWARLMQSEIDAGKKLEDVVGVCTKVADINLIDPMTFNIAAYALASSWEYAEQLRLLAEASVD